MKRRWAVFISGTGSNMMALLENQYPAHISLIVSSNLDAYGIRRAKRRSTPVAILDFKNAAHNDYLVISDWNKLIETLKHFNINSIMLAGFMKILPAEFIEAFNNRIFNIHPSLLPDYPGLGSIKKAFGDKKPSGCTVHRVDEGVDTGDILYQKKVNLEDTFEWTELKVHIQEHKLCRKVLNLTLDANREIIR